MAKGKGLFLQINSKGMDRQGGINNSEIVELLKNFKRILEEPQELPLTRNHDHRIILKEETQPISTRPYQYPYYQKFEIEKTVAELLKFGMIRLSSSPFSSSMLLVHKVDGSWRLYFDYRALNQVTVKDKFPISVIDELLNELCGGSSVLQIGSKIRIPSDSSGA